jgi:mono/diheme cytochrome c family protein
VALAVWAMGPRATFVVAADAPAADFAQGGRPFLEKHCLACHSGAEPKAELSLEAFRDSAAVVKQRKVWDSVLKMVTAGDMPPVDRPRPTVAEVEAFTAHVRAVFDHADRNAKPDPGRVTMRRLNRTEYKNTVRDLLGVDFDPTEDFPSDDIGHGFDNIGDVLTLSPVLMERYLAAAETIADRVILVNPPPPARRYLAGRFLQPNNAQTSQAEFRVLDPTSPEPVHSGPFMAPADYLKFSADADLILRATLYAEPKGASPAKVALFILGNNLQDVSSDEEVDQLLGAKVPRPMKILKTYEITARDARQPQEIEYPIRRMGNLRNAGVALIKPPKGEEPARLFIQHIWSEGPLETRPKSHLMILGESPQPPTTERKREALTRLLRRAYRRPATEEEVRRVSALVEEAQAEGEKWEAGVQRAIQAILCSPKFLFRVELDDRPQSPEPRPLDEFQLASRLSYFLWSTMPDDELLDLADQGQLTPNLEQQVRRMLADPKSSELVRNFALQWLQVERLEWIAPDAQLFPSFNNRLRAAMLKETELFFESIVREDRSVLDLLDADYTFLNEPLARHYGIADANGNWVGQKPQRPRGGPIRGEGFQRVSLQGRLRGGLLTQASVLTVTSNPTRTSPVKRGKWVLEQLLGEPPPPPPPNVPELPSNPEAVAGASLRKRLEIHRANPSCANCHAKMDPIGFALENYDAVGAFRTKDGEFDVDASGEFADGTRFSGPEDLKSILREKKGAFARSLAEKMLIYALGRGLEYYDRPTTERIVTELSAHDYKFSVLVTEIVRSDPFRLRRGSDGEASVQ